MKMRSYQNFLKKLIELIPEDKPIRIGELARILNCSRKTVLRWLYILEFCQLLPKVHVVPLSDTNAVVEFLTEEYKKTADSVLAKLDRI
jgi:transcriptional antiterminator